MGGGSGPTRGELDGGDPRQRQIGADEIGPSLAEENRQPEELAG